MKIDTARFGEIEINPETVLAFPRGLAGFEDCTRFKLLHDDSGKRVVFYLQSLDDPALSFSIVDPSVFGLDYELVLSDEECELLQSSDASQIAVVLIVYKPVETAAAGMPKGVAANINGPLVLNVEKKLGMQKIILEPQVDITLRDRNPA